jgi:FlaA1/EpsC-like NDP-sugar epimerase
LIGPPPNSILVLMIRTSNEEQQMEIRGATAVVTGAGGGLGKCLTEELLERGVARV